MRKQDILADTLLTVADVSKQCQVSERTVRRWISNEKLRAVKICHLVRIWQSDLNKFTGRQS